MTGKKEGTNVGQEILYTFKGNVSLNNIWQELQQLWRLVSLSMD
jgi:hypothetical protein